MDGGETGVVGLGEGEVDAQARQLDTLARPLEFQAGELERDALLIDGGLHRGGKERELGADHGEGSLDDFRISDGEACDLGAGGDGLKEFDAHGFERAGLDAANVDGDRLGLAMSVGAEAERPQSQHAAATPPRKMTIGSNSVQKTRQRWSAGVGMGGSVVILRIRRRRSGRWAGWRRADGRVREGGRKSARDRGAGGETRAWCRSRLRRAFAGGTRFVGRAGRESGGARATRRRGATREG